jgi:hypothetical protein
MLECGTQPALKPVTSNSVEVCLVSRGAAEAAERRVRAARAKDFMMDDIGGL